MATIQSTIELHDMFSSPLNNIISVTDTATEAMTGLQDVMGSPIGTEYLESAELQFNEAASAAENLAAVVEGLPGSAYISLEADTDLPFTEGDAAVSITADTSQATEAASGMLDNIPGEMAVDITADTSRAAEAASGMLENIPAETAVDITADTSRAAEAASGMLDNIPDKVDITVAAGWDQVQELNSRLSVSEAIQQRLNRTPAGVIDESAAAEAAQLNRRLQETRAALEFLEANPFGLDTETTQLQLEAIAESIADITARQQGLNDAAASFDLSSAQSGYSVLEDYVSSTGSAIDDNFQGQEDFNSAIESGSELASTLYSALKKVVSVYAIKEAVSSIVDTSDELTLTTARLNLMNDGLQTTDELVEMVYQAAQEARGSFSDMASVVARFGNNAADAFSSSAEVVEFATLVQKEMTIAGASTTEAANAMLQLSQGLASGTLRGDELNSIFEQAPNLIQDIADYLGVTTGEIRDLASEGELSAEVVKEAIFAAADEINEEFESIPMTWAQIWQSIKNTALMAFEPVLDKINDLFNSDRFSTAVDAIIGALYTVASVAYEVLNVTITVVSAIADNWSVISPIMYGVAAALGVYYGAQLLIKSITAINTGLHIAAAAGQMIHAAATGTLTAATAAQIAAQNGLNAAMYACPLTWIIALIAIIIGMLYAAVAVINNIAGTSVSATGIITAAIATAAAVVWNIIVALGNFVIDIGVTLWNFIAAFANFFANVFNDPVSAIAHLFFNLADTVLSLLQAIASAIDTIFGSNLASAVQGWRDSLSDWVDDTFGESEEIMATINADNWKLEGIDYSDAWSSGYSFGEGIEDSVAGIFSYSTDTDDYSYDYSAVDYESLLSETEDISDDTSSISDSLDCTDEELKYLRDIAEQEAVNRYTVAEITIEQTNNNSVSSSMDLDGVVSGLTDAVNEAIDSITEGVHI